MYSICNFLSRKVALLVCNVFLCYAQENLIDEGSFVQLPKKVLMIRMDRLGDALITTPAIRAFATLFPEIQLDFLARTLNAPALRNNPYIHTLYQSKEKNIFNKLALVSNLRKQYTDILVMNGSSRSDAFIAKLLAPQHMWGFPVERTKRFFATCPTPQLPQAIAEDAFVQEHALQQHIIAHTLAVVELFAQQYGRSLAQLLSQHCTAKQLFSLDFSLPTRKDYHLTITPPSQSTQYIENNKRLAIFIGNAKKNETRWQLEKFIALVETLLTTQHNIAIFLILGKDEKKLLQQSKKKFPQSPRCFCVEGSLEAIGKFLQSVDLFITSSTSLTHIAAALNIPTLHLHGLYVYTVWRPIGPMHHFICSNDSGVNVHSIPVDVVLQKVQSLLFEPFPEESTTLFL